MAKKQNKRKSAEPMVDVVEMLNDDYEAQALLHIGMAYGSKEPAQAVGIAQVYANLHLARQLQALTPKTDKSDEMDDCRGPGLDEPVVPAGVGG